MIRPRQRRHSETTRAAIPVETSVSLENLVSNTTRKPILLFLLFGLFLLR